MSGPKIPGGYILLSRKLIESEIWNKPPLYIKVWVYLLARAQHRDFKGLKRGQVRTSIPEIQEACSWYVGFRKVTPTYKQIRSVIDFLRFPYEGNTKGNMIGTMKGTHGILVDIVNYDLYQDPKSYEGHNEGITKDERRAREGHNTNKNDLRMYKNDNNIDAEMSEAMTLFAELFGPPNSTHIIMMNSFIEDGLTPWHIKEALTRAAGANAAHPNYIKQILQSWVKEEAFTQADVEEIEKRHERMKQKQPAEGPRRPLEFY